MVTSQGNRARTASAALSPFSRKRELSLIEPGGQIPLGGELSPRTGATSPAAAGELEAWRAALVRSSVAWLALLVVTLCAAPIASQATAGAQTVGGGVHLNFQDADLPVVISALAELAGLTVIYSGLPSRPVTLRSSAPLPRTGLRELLESVVRSNGLELVEEGGFIRIIDPSQGAGSIAVEVTSARAPLAGNGVGGTRLFVHRLRHTKAEIVAQTIREVFDLGDRTAGDAFAGRRPLSEELRRQRLTLPPDGGYHPGERAETPTVGDLPATGASLTTGLEGAVQIVPDALTNTLLIRSSPADYETVRAAIDELDVRPLQVLIEVLIAEIRRDHRRDLGVEINVPDWKDTESGVSIGGALTGVSAGDLTLRVLGLGGVRADVVLRALASQANVNILSRPVILAQNNQTARILVGSQRPFVQLFRSLPTDAAVRDQIVQYRDVGTQLTITPTINLDGYVTLSLLQEVSTATAETQFGAPVISTREAETQLFVRDKHTVVIGGLIDHQRETVNSGVPLLKNIPLLGLLFRSSRTRQSATELFLLITPHVLRSDEDLDAATRELGERSPMIRDELRRRHPNIEPGASPEPEVEEP